MHLTLSKDTFHFFIEKNELQTLLDGKSVKHSFSQGHSSFNYSIRPYNEEDIFKLYLTPLSIVLFVDSNRLQKLENNHGPSTKKLTMVQDGITVALDLVKSERDVEENHKKSAKDESTSKSSSKHEMAHVTA